MLSIQGYGIRQELCRGTHISVYRAVRENDRQPVLIKVPKRYDRREEIAGFRHERDVLFELAREDVVPEHRSREADGRVFLETDDEGGQTLRSLISAGPLPIEDALWIGIELARHLAAIHHHQIIHKDVHPANVLVRSESRHTHLMTFSLATRLPRQSHSVVSPGSLEGLLPYISPEQTGRMNRLIDYRTDLYSLGVTLFEMLCGEPPFVSDDPMEMVHSHIARPARRCTELRPDVPPVAAEIIHRLLAKNAEDRYQSCDGLAADLEECRRRLTGAGTIKSFELGRRDFSYGLEIPQKLYGRGDEVSALIRAFEQVSQGRSELMLVAGYSGIGKSALIQEIHKPVIRRQGYFVSGKFEQNKQNIPYFAFVQAFRELVRQLLTENAERIAQWREQMTAAVAGDGQVLVDVIPELELILGPQAAVPDLPEVEAEQRFLRVVRGVLRIFKGRGQPLVVFLDDLQWVDPASLKLISAVVSDLDNQDLFLIGTYRDNEVGATHPLTLAVERMEKAGIAVRRLHLRPLGLSHVTELVSDALRVHGDRARALAELLLDKTGGNPFFLIQFLRSLHVEGLLVFHREQRQWRWDVDEIRSKDRTDNVIDLMVRSLRRLGDQTQNVLGVAACVGNQFSLPVLQRVAQLAGKPVIEELWPAIRQGFVTPIGGGYRVPIDDQAEPENAASEIIACRFLHDRIHAAAYSLNSLEQRTRIHYEVGHFMLVEHGGENGLGERIFEVVDHLNAARELIRDDAGRLRLARLNLMAGRRAYSSTAFGPARDLLDAALELLGDDGWTDAYQLTFDVQLLKSRCAYLQGDHGEAEEGFDELLERARFNHERLDLYTIKTQLRRHAIQYEDAVQVALAGLATAGLDFPGPRDDDALKAKVAAKAPAVEARLAGRKIEELIDLPELQSQEFNALMSLLEELSVLAVFFVPSLIHLATLEMLDLTLSHGSCPATSSAYVLYGMYLSTERGDAATGYRFGRLAYDLSHKYADPSAISKSGVFLGTWLHHWRRPVVDTLPVLEDAYITSFRSGVPAYGSYAAFFISVHTLGSGANLAEADESFAKYQHHLDGQGLAAALSYRDMLVAMRLGPEALEGHELALAPDYAQRLFDDSLFLALHHHANSRALLHYLLDDAEAAERAIDFAESSGSIEEVLYAQYAVTERVYYHALVLARLVEKGGERQEERRQRLRRQAEKLDAWSEACEENFRCRGHLVAAEIARLEGDPLRAADLYDRAAETARAHGFQQVEATAHELAGRLYLGLGRATVARLYLRKAHRGFLRWGAEAKARHMESAYGELLRAEPDAWREDAATAAGFAGAMASEDLDLMTVMKASQAISGEIVLARLLQRMLQISLENAGAERGALILMRDHRLTLMAEGSLERGVAMHPATPIDERDDLPRSVLEYVHRTGETVVLDDAARQERFQSDPYMKRPAAGSVFCLPILKRGDAVGLLYLENRNTRRTFTPDRVRLLQLLASQAAISLENAELYDTLEQKVVERTQELQEKNTELETTLKRLKEARDRMIVQERMASLGSLTAGIAHELKNPLNFVCNFANLSVALAGQLGETLKESREAPSGEVWDDAHELLEDLRSNAEKISHHGRRADGIIKSMLGHSHTNGGQLQEVDLGALLKSYVNLASHARRIEDRALSIDIGVDIDPGLRPFVCVPQEIGRVLINLLDNACYAVSSKAKRLPADSDYRPRVKISIRDEGQEVRIAVRDNGPGIPPEVQDRIFDPFFTTKETGEGTGLGLSLCYDIVVNGNGGTMSFKTRPGEHTELAMSLPRRSLH